MTYKKAEKLLEELFYKHVPKKITNERKWRFSIEDLNPAVWGNTNVRNGCSSIAFYFESKIPGITNFILISKFIVKYAPDTIVVETMLHEIAHVIVGTDAGHTKVWKDVARKIGYAKPKASIGYEWVTKEILKTIINEKELTIPKGIMKPELLFEIHQEPESQLTYEKIVTLLRNN